MTTSQRLSPPVTFGGALVLGRDGAAALVDAEGGLLAAREDVAGHLAGAGRGGRWVVWTARSVSALLDGPAPTTALDRTWDLAEVHRLLHGGSAAEPGRVWAAAHDLDTAGLPVAPSGDLFDLLAEEPDADLLVLPDGHLRPSVLAWADTDERCAALARAGLEVARWQHARVAERGRRALLTACSESAAAVLCVELERTGLPIDRPALDRLLTAAAGPEPRSVEDELSARQARDAPVLAAVPGAGRIDLRNPAGVRRLLSLAGVEVSSTRKWVLEAHREAHQVVPAILAWRKAERVATTYGWRWRREHVGADDRLRGAWSAADGAAGRMTAQAGLHNLPAELRPAVAAAPGHVLVRADLGQIEPRVLAAVAGDGALAAATREPDLYAPVAERLGVERAVAKVAVLAAMYGQRSGSAGEALRGLERAYPVAMRALQAAAETGARGEPVRTFGGRTVRTDLSLGERVLRAQLGPGEAPREVEDGSGSRSAAADADQERWRDAARGRFARNAIIQGSAAELFKVWAVTARVGLRALDARIVLCLHDELIVHVPRQHAQAAVTVVEGSLQDAARWWVGDDAVRFVADLQVVQRWSDVD